MTGSIPPGHGEAGLRRRVFRLLEGHRRQNRTARWVQLGLGVLIVANVIAVVVESEPGLSPAVLDWLGAFEWASVAIFSVEYVLRVWVAVEADPYRKAGPSARTRALCLQPAGDGPVRGQ